VCRSPGWPSEVKNAVVIPIMVSEGSDNNSIPKAVLIVGLNPRRPWNEIFATFLNLLTRNLSTGLLAVTVRFVVRCCARRMIADSIWFGRGFQMAETEALRTEELVQLDRAKTNFFSNVSHEVRCVIVLRMPP
jgi:hypothetical protein